jgi:hypothetical protein
MIVVDIRLFNSRQYPRFNPRPAGVPIKTPRTLYCLVVRGLGLRGGAGRALLELFLEQRYPLGHQCHISFSLNSLSVCLNSVPKGYDVQFQRGGVDVVAAGQHLLGQREELVRFGVHNGVNP